MGFLLLLCECVCADEAFFSLPATGQIHAVLMHSPASSPLYFQPGECIRKPPAMMCRYEQKLQKNSVRCLLFMSENGPNEVVLINIFIRKHSESEILNEILATLTFTNTT